MFFCRAFSACPLYKNRTRGYALRARPWLPSFAPAALNLLLPLRRSTFFCPCGAQPSFAPAALKLLLPLRRSPSFAPAALNLLLPCGAQPSLRLRRSTFFCPCGAGRENNFAPRLGLVLVPFANGRTVMRGGVGLFYDKIPLNVGSFEQYRDFVVTTFANDGTTIVDGPRLFLNTAPSDLKNPYSVA
jgi:hypothetical protein